VRILARVLLYVLLALVLVVGLAFATGWWIVHRALPQLDGTASLPELKQEVTVDRDVWGVPHIRAGSLEDLLTAQGYVLAQDRLWQMDIVRRIAAGELSEVFGPVGLERDREFRTLGLYLAAEREAGRLDPQLRGLLEAYARGVNRYIEEHRSKLPWEFIAMGYQPRPWRPADSLLVAGYMYHVLTTTWKAELRRSIVSELVDPERAADLYAADSPLDHPIVGAAPADTPASSPARTPAPKPHRPRKQNGAPRATLSPPLEWRAAKAVLDQFGEEIRAGLGSNDWVVDGKHTASGKPLLANDTHLPLNIPCIWYMLHLTAPGWNVKGFALPGAPLVIIGHNERIAWGFTNNGADIQDLYIESFSRTNPRQYVVNGNYVDTEVRTERIKVKGRPDEVFDVLVTRHGPIVQRGGGRAYALKWTALEPGGLSGAYSMVGAARNWEEFRDALRQVPGPAQNAVYADVDGNIGFIVAARIPMRKKGNGAVPVPGDTDDYEWTGYIPFDELPQVLNPPGGVIATANARVVGPGYPHYLTDRWASPYRAARIYALLGEKTNFRPEDFLAIQTDIVSLPHRFLADQLVRASQAAQPKDERAKALIARLAGWDGRAQAGSVETSFVEYTRRALLRNLLQPYLGEETALYDWRDAVFLEKVLGERPARWLPTGFRSYDELLAASADQAVERLTRDTQSPETGAWRWGRLNALRIVHPLGRSGWRQRLLSIGPLEQRGTVYTVKAAQPSHGPAMRFVADLSNLDNSLINITLGESGQYGSAHYLDEFSAWFEGQGIAAPFSNAAEEKTRAHRLRLLPAGR
jgi:penicillin amidase